MTRYLVVLLVFVVTLGLGAQQVVNPPGSGGTVTSTQGTPAATTDATAWPVKVVFGNAQIDPRLVTIQNASIPVTGTFFQVTQPVSGTVTVGNASLAVTGTFWQATQPVSGTFWQATQPVSFTSVPADPFGVNADAASATGSISAKLRFIAATGIPITSFPDNEPFNQQQIGGNTISTGVGASGTGTARTASLIHDGTDTALVTADGSLQAEPPRTSYMSIGGQESVAAPTAAVWYVRKQWALPASAHFTPNNAWATITTALTKTLIAVGNNLGNLNLSTNTYTAANSVASPFFYGRLFGCVTTIMSATADTITPTYTDELGNSQAATGVAFASASPVGNCYEFPLAAGTPASALDAGVRAVTAASDSAAPTGVVTFYGVNPIADFAGTAANQTETQQFSLFSELNANEQIFIFMMQAATTAQLKTFGIGGSLR